MTPKERADHLQKACRSIGEDQGRRCAKSYDEDRGISDNACVMAGAISMSVLIGLRALSYTKLLGPNDIQAAIDGFFDAANIEETRTAMGAIVYQRKVKVVA